VREGWGERGMGVREEWGGWSGVERGGVERGGVREGGGERGMG
jgi:hypothetical protein